MMYDEHEDGEHLCLGCGDCFDYPSIEWDESGDEYEVCPWCGSDNIV